MPVPGRAAVRGGASARCGPLLAAVLLLAGCASPKLDAQWRAPTLQPGLLHGARVLVRCQAPADADARLCIEAHVAELVRHGATPIAGAPAVGEDEAPEPARLAAEARAVDAAAALFATIVVRATVAQPGPAISIGLGGGSWGGRGSVGVGGSVAMPIGGGSVNQALGASTLVVRAADGELVWSARTSAVATDPAPAQLADLARLAADAMQQDGLF